MVKKHTTFNIDHELLEKFKEKGYNMSEVAEEAMKAKLEIQNIEIHRSLGKCEFCGKNSEEKLSWIYPDEKWICNYCLIEQGRKILKP